MASILVVGGAGYIGSHMTKYLSQRNHHVVVLDNLSTGHREAVRDDQLVVADLSDVEALERVFSQNEFNVVLHFAAASLVNESVEDPAKYYRNNVSYSLNLLDMMRKYAVNHLVFSSTAAIFGNPDYTPIDEAHPHRPINPYGSSKLMIEKIIGDYAKSYSLNAVSLRYFNAAGADPDGELGENHDPETHLIPLILRVASGRRDCIEIFGNDYPTEDGTCIRDYIHVKDLCSAHERALELLLDHRLMGFSALNLGSGRGYSVREVIRVAQAAVHRDGKTIKVIESGRRSGDPAILVADSSRANSVLNWQPDYCDIESMIEHAWEWEKLICEKS